MHRIFEMLGTWSIFYRPQIGGPQCIHIRANSPEVNPLSDRHPDKNSTKIHTESTQKPNRDTNKNRKYTTPNKCSEWRAAWMREQPRTLTMAAVKVMALDEFSMSQSTMNARRPHNSAITTGSALRPAVVFGSCAFDAAAVGPSAQSRCRVCPGRSEARNFRIAFMEMAPVLVVGICVNARARPTEMKAIKKQTQKRTRRDDKEKNVNGNVLCDADGWTGNTAEPRSVVKHTAGNAKNDIPSSAQNEAITLPCHVSGTISP